MKLLLFILYYRSALHKLFSLSYLWYSTLGLIIAVGVGLLVTAVTGECWGVGGGRGGLDGRDHFKTALISCRRRALYNKIEKHSNLKLNCMEFFLYNSL